MVYFMTTTEGTLAKELVRLFRDNMWKLYGLPKSMILDREPQFVVKLTKKLDRISRIEIKLLTSFYLQIDKQTE